MLANKFMQKYLAEKISLQKSGGSLDRLNSVLAKATIDLNPHQIQAALYAFNSPLSRGAILADEVGLGKTIEAGIIVSQLWAEGKHRILILVPASLRNQWGDELLTKFGLESEVWDGPSFRKCVSGGGKVPFTYDGIFISSYQFVYSNLGLIKQQPWDVVIIDEAHRFRRVFRGRDASKMAYEIREILKDKPKVLLTATPLQNGLEELYGIASFIDEKQLGTFYSFQTRFINPIKQGGATAKLRLEELRRLIRGDEGDEDDSVSGIITRTLRNQVLEYVPFRDRASMTFDFTPTDEEVELYESVSEYLKRPDIAAITHTQRNLMVLVYRKLLASSTFAISGTLKKLVENLEEELRLRDEDKKVEEVFPEDIYDEGLEEELEEFELEEIEEKKKVKQRLGVNHSDLEIKHELEELRSYYNKAVQITENTKGVELIKALHSLTNQAKKNSWPEKAIIFTESRRTQEYLTKLLKSEGFSVTQFSGTNNSSDARKAFEVWKKEFPEAAQQGSANANIRQALVHEFKTKTQIFLTTEAGSEGLNLQFANIIINFDLPWNPQRVEQRIGRCHRYGQKYKVIVANFLNTRNYADRRVLQLLEEKLNLFDGLFGSSDEILGALESGVDFEKRILDIYQNCKSPEEYDKAFDELQAKLKESITSDMLNCRKMLLENADQAVAGLFKKTMVETNQIISEFDQELLELLRLSYGERAKETEDGIYEVPDFEFPIAFRELKPDEIGKISRASKDHPVLSRIIQYGIKVKTKPIPSITFPLSSSGKKITKLVQFIGKDGYIFLWKLRVNGVESEELLAPLVFISENGKFETVDVVTANELFKIDSVESAKTIEKSPVSQEQLFESWDEWKEQVLQKYKNKNEKLFDRESDRINRYYDSVTVKVDDKMEKLVAEIVDAERRKDNSSDFEDRNKYRKQIEDFKIKLDKLETEKLKLKTSVVEDRKNDLEGLWKKLELKTDEHLIAITHFELR